MPRLLEPLESGKLRLKNRLVMAPVNTGKAEPDGSVNQRLIDHYANVSRGGYLGLVVIEHSFISLEGKYSLNQTSIESDYMLGGMAKVAEAIHANGSKAVLQITHAGSAALREITGAYPVGPSAISNPKLEKGTGRAIPHVLSKEEIKGIVLDFQAAAMRAKKAGFDGVNIHSAHGYLLNQFYSPLTNQRDDEYGGSVKRRVRIHSEIVQAIREKAGEDFPIMLRLGAADYMENGSVAQDGVAAAVELEKAGVDIFDISGGFCGYINPGVSQQGYFAELSKAVKMNVNAPVLLTGGITDAADAERLLNEGQADLIGVARAVMKDAEWPRKAVEQLAD